MVLSLPSRSLTLMRIKSVPAYDIAVYFNCVELVWSGAFYLKEQGCSDEMCTGILSRGSLLAFCTSVAISVSQREQRIHASPAEVFPLRRLPSEC